MFNIENVGIISSACIGNGRQGRLLIERPGRDSKIPGGGVYTVLELKSLPPVTIHGDKFPCKAFYHGVHCHHIKLILTSASIFTVTATSEAQFELLEGSLCILGSILIELQTFLAQYFETSIVYIFNFPLEIPLCQS